jgi:hypothetical protein
MGPILTFDKSFLQMLSPDEVDELDLQFELFVTPVLVSEILADLAHPEPEPGRIPEEMVMALARKMVSNHGVMQAHWRMLALGELSQIIEFPMVGSVVVDRTAPNVMTSRDGRGLIYDSRQDREMWGTWAAGNFSETDKYLAAKWRSQSADINLGEISESWTEFCAKYLPGVKNTADVIAGIDDVISRPEAQNNLLNMIYHFTEAPTAARRLSMALAIAGLLPRIKPWAPFCVSVARLCMVLCCCTALKFVTQRPTNVLDLQYLFYAPFGMVFVSHDKLQRDLWPATTTQASFVWGDELKADLKRYVLARKETMAAREAGETVGYYTDRFTPEDSIIARLHEKHLIWPRGSGSSSGPTGDFENLPEGVKRGIREAMELIDEQDAARGGPPKFHG